MRSYLSSLRFYSAGFFTMKDHVKLYNMEIKITKIDKDARGVYVELTEPLEYPSRFGQPSNLGFIGEIEIIKVVEGMGQTRYYLEKEPSFNTGDSVIFTLDRVRENLYAVGDVDDFNDCSPEDNDLEELGRKKFD